MSNLTYIPRSVVLNKSILSHHNLGLKDRIMIQVGLKTLLVNTQCILIQICLLGFLSNSMIVEELFRWVLGTDRCQ
jgi:hypothetical protein